MALLLLCAVALVAGLIDAIAGGGGLLSLPALLMVLPDARIALGTGKAQSSFGTAASLYSYARAGHVDRRRALPSFVAGGIGAFVGVQVVLVLKPEIIRPVVLVLLVAAALFFAVRGRPRDKRAAAERSPAAAAIPAGISIARSQPVLVASVIGGAIGFYDGFFGPGAGTFLIASYVAVFGDDLPHATANAKVTNFASNIVALGAFAAAGKVDFRIAIPMAGAQVIGGYLGARAAIRGGDRLVRAGVLVVTLAMAVRLGWQILGSAMP